MEMLLHILLMTLVGSSCGQQPCDANNPCPPGSDCHPRENRCYDNPTGTNRPYVWLGEAPDRCNRKPSDCAFFGFTYDMAHPRGDGEWCNSGYKYRCLAPEAPQLAPPTPANELRMVSYNIFERDFFITNDGQRERTCRIPYVMLQKWPNLDVIGFQEGFMGGCFSESLSLRNLFSYLGFPHSTATVSSEEIPENGGMFLVSRWPISDEDQMVFNSSYEDSWDQFAAKGVSYGRITKTMGGQSRDYHVMTTHYQAGGPNEVRLNQSREWSDFVQRKNIPPSEPVIYSGDLNADYYTRRDTLNSILSILRADLPQFVGTLNATSHPGINDILNETRPGGRESWLDYVLQSNVHLAPSSATLEALYPTAEEPFAICWCEQCIPLDGYIYPDDPECERVRFVRHLSDHFPVLGTFTF